MEWGILGAAAIFVVVGYIVLQGTRASMAWRRAASGGDVEVIRQILEDEIASWRSVKRPKEVAPDVWRGVQSVALVEVAAGSGPTGALLGASVSCQVESEYRLWTAAGWRCPARSRRGSPLPHASPTCSCTTCRTYAWTPSASTSTLRSGTPTVRRSGPAS